MVPFCCCYLAEVMSAIGKLFREDLVPNAGNASDRLKKKKKGKSDEIANIFMDVF